jgi:hypothetical protein
MSNSAQNQGQRGTGGGDKNADMHRKDGSK